MWFLSSLMLFPMSLSDIRRYYLILSDNIILILSDIILYYLLLYLSERFFPFYFSSERDLDFVISFPYDVSSFLFVFDVTFFLLLNFSSLFFLRNGFGWSRISALCGRRKHDCRHSTRRAGEWV